MSSPVSGPGPLSQRTDRQPISVPTGLPYGDAQQLHATEAAAPMQATPSVPSMQLSAPGAGGGAPPPPPPMINDPSHRPNEPVTHGADYGPGADSSILTQSTAPPVGGVVSQAIARAAASDTSGTLQQLLMAAQQRGL